MVPVKSFMVPKEKFVTVDRDMDARSAAALMRDRNIGSLFVSRGNEVIGILTDTDMVRRVVVQRTLVWRHMVRRVVAVGLDASKTPVEQIMSAPILTIEENRTLLDANDMMAGSHLRHLGVARDGKLVGMISVRDLVVFLTNLPRK